MNNCTPEKLYESNLINAIDLELANFMGRFAVDDSPELRLAVALTSYMTSSNEESSLDLAACAGSTVGDFFKKELLFSQVRPPEKLLLAHLPELDCWREKINAAALETMVLYNGHRLYLRRWWNYEERVIQILNSRLEETDSEPDDALLDRYDLTGEQRAAAIMAMRGKLSIITGGPGTGKTTTFTSILAMLQQRSATPLRIVMAAPSGKAAQRMQEAFDSACSRLKIENLNLQPASTIHRLLGFSRGFRFSKYHRDNPIPADVAVIDECSMIPLALLYKLLEAIPPHAHIIMLGDPNQLEPVESGAAFNDICRAAKSNPQIRHRVAELIKSYRFATDSSIGKLSNIILNGKTEELGQLVDNPPENVNFMKITPTNRILNLKKVSGHFQYCLHAEKLSDAFAAFSKHRILSACNCGLLGCREINDLICAHLSPHPLYRGLPIMITVNDYNEMLFSGNIGMIWSDDDNEQLYAGFPDGTDGFRHVRLNMLPPWIPAYATTVHKAQGSEAEHIVLIMPANALPLLSRELFFTGVTRARKSIEIWYENVDQLMTATEHSQATHGGITEKLTVH
ncbi:MAG: exodeoxyribonuclease V subunit alpha [Victivallaceae bacterium]|nr:exodeoxyribonuclease V subunit alpha [Victivallaceae bacterium]